MTTSPRSPSLADRLIATLPIPGHWRPNPRVLLPALPVIIFWALTQTVPPQMAIIGGFLSFCVVFYLTRETRTFQALSALTFGVIAVSTVVGLVSSSEKAFLAAGPVTDFIVAPIFLISAATRMPLVGAVTKETVPGLAAHLPTNAPVFIWLTVFWALFNIATGTMRSFMLANMSVGEYMAWSRIIGWPLGWSMIALLGVIILLAARRAQTTDHNAAVTP